MRDLAQALGGFTTPFDLRRKDRKISVAVTGLTTTPFHPAHAQIGVPLDIELDGLRGTPALGPVSVRIDGVEVATTAPYTPLAASDGQRIAIGRHVNGILHLSDAYPVRHAPPLAIGALPPLSAAPNAPIPETDVSAGFSGDGLSFALSPVSDPLPAGLSLSPAGILSGVPEETSPARRILVRAGNSGGYAESGVLIEIAGAALAVTLAEAPEIVAVQGSEAISVDASGWVAGGIAPYAFSAEGLNGRVSARGTGPDDVELVIEVFGDPALREPARLTVTDGRGDEVHVALTVTIEAAIALSGKGDTLTWTPYDLAEGFTFDYGGRTYASTLGADASGPVNLVPPRATGTAASGSTLTAIWGLWQADTAFGAVTLTREWRAGDGAVLGTGDTYEVRTADGTGGLYLYEKAAQGLFPAREAFAEIIAATDGQSMVLDMTTDGIGSGGTPRALTSQPLTMTTDGF